ncbi:nuclear transport factor 2 family protein [Catenulispora subtropica]|uniref:Nuclear transport factor 2 family protein n=1 Tax=Catenulispora subtropica TaxID=450798 RepID=A0ABP5CE97_9ACTN
MTSEDMIARVNRYYGYVDDGDIESLLSLFSHDAVYSRPGYGPLTGRAEMAAFYSGERIIKEGRHTLSCIVSQGDHAAVHGSFSGTLKDGREVNLRFADFFIDSGGGTFSRRDTFFFTPLV